MNYETLESRRLMSVTASISAGVLSVFGDDQVNGISVELAGSDVVVKQYAGGGSYAQVYKTKASNVDLIKLFGRGGDDSIYVADNIPATVIINGGAGGDYLQAGGISAFVFGDDQAGATSGDKNDTLLSGGVGTCQMYGQNGSDLFIFSRNASVGNSGKDFAFGGSGDDRFSGIRDQRQLHEIHGNSGQDMIDFTDYGVPVYAVLDGVTKCGHRDGIAKPDDNYLIFPDVEGAKGTPFDDVLSGGTNNSTGNDLRGQGGNDTIYGRGGSDTIQGSVGADWLEGNSGDDLVLGDYGNDTVDGGTGRDSLYGGEDNDSVVGGGGTEFNYIFGNGGRDTLKGGDGKDKIDGGDGNDSILGNAGDDTLLGGKDDDTLVGGNGGDSMIGGYGSDLLDARDGTPGNDICWGDEVGGSNSPSWFNKALLDKGTVLGVQLFDLAGGMDQMVYT